MKPMIIIQSLNEDGLIHITEEKLTKLISDAYEEGRKDMTLAKTPVLYPPGVRSPEFPGTIKWNDKSGDSYGG